jgi:hypothetical protein
VDEMMQQFKGREDELLETLRTMQERQVAHKARTTTNKQVKLEAKQAVRGKRQLAEIALSQQEEKKNREEASTNTHPSRKVAPPPPLPFSPVLPPTSKSSPDPSVHSAFIAADEEGGSYSPSLSQTSLFDVASALDYSGVSSNAPSSRESEANTTIASSSILEKSAASQATDWAIAQSLSKMEQKDRASGASSDQDHADNEGQESV